MHVCFLSLDIIIILKLRLYLEDGICKQFQSELEIKCLKGYGTVKSLGTTGLDDGSFDKLSHRVNKPILEEVKKKKSALVKAIAKKISLLMNMAASFG